MLVAVSASSVPVKYPDVDARAENSAYEGLAVPHVSGRIPATLRPAICTSFGHLMPTAVKHGLTHLGNCSAPSILICGSASDCGRKIAETASAAPGGCATSAPFDRALSCSSAMTTDPAAAPDAASPAQCRWCYRHADRSAMRAAQARSECVRA
jgi:hypothetical protein